MASKKKRIFGKNKRRIEGRKFGLFPFRVGKKNGKPNKRGGGRKQSENGVTNSRQIGPENIQLLRYIATVASAFFDSFARDNKLSGRSGEKRKINPRHLALLSICVKRRRKETKRKRIFSVYGSHARHETSNSIMKDKC